MRACAVEMHLDISEGACFVRIYRKMPRPRNQPHVLLEPAPSKIIIGASENICREFPGKMPRPRSQPQVFCELAQSKCTKSKMSQAKSEQNSRGRLCASLRSRHALGHRICAKIYRKKADQQLVHPDQAPACTLTLRIPQCGYPVLGK